jgi:hypothetical protein
MAAVEYGLGMELHLFGWSDGGLAQYRGGDEGLGVGVRGGWWIWTAAGAEFGHFLVLS